MFWRSHLAFIAFNMVKMQANGFTFTMQPAIEAIYKDDPAGKEEAYLRHQNFFNTNAVPFSFIAGLSYAMEKEKKETGSIDGATINSIKVGLMGPTAGMFDSLFFNGLRIIAAGIAIGFNSQGNFLGTLLFILLYGFTQSIAKYFLLNWGYTAGTTAIDEIFSSGMMNALTKATSILGLMMVGAMVAQMVNVPLTWTINSNGTKLVINDVLNGIFPGLLSIGLVFGLVALIKKGWRPLYLVFGVLALGLIGALIGIF